ncbi:MAG TPA: arsenite methyltransferase [Byssovorax sp.]|jgi:SAM-dependent methyltransferase
MNTNDPESIRDAVRETYGNVAKSDGKIGCAPGCCGAPSPNASLALGYSAEDLDAVPEGADMGLGCGNPQAIASLKAGEVVVDLGSGGGFDAFLAARQVGPSGRVIGVDMTSEMISKARSNAAKVDAKNVEFRLGEIEHLPIADGAADVILSNCVVNLSPDKQAVFREAFRVLRPGGRLAIADIVALGPMPADVKTKIEAMVGCIAGAATVAEIEAWLAAAGFASITVTPKPESAAIIRDWSPGSGWERYAASATIEAVKPGGAKSCCGPSCCAEPAQDGPPQAGPHA